MKNPYRLPDPGVQKTKKQLEREVTIEEYYKAVSELQDLQEQYGIEPEDKPKEGKISKAITSFFDHREEKEKVCVSKKKYVWTAVLLGWAGGHRFLVKQRGVGLLYLLVCWSGFSMAHTVIDLLIVLPMKPDENGNIMM